jgi:uncharacterized protein (DUF1684 family)
VLFVVLALMTAAGGGAVAVAGGAGGARGAGGCAGGDDAAYRREIEAWQKNRDVRLRAEGGWLTLAGLFWLKPGENRFGSRTGPQKGDGDGDSDGKGNDIVLPAHSSPPRAGAFLVDGSKVEVVVAPGAAVTLAGKPVTRAVLRSDGGSGEPDILALGSLTMQVIERQGRLAIRLKDARSPTRRQFKGLRYYPINRRYRVLARFVAHPRPVSITVPNILGHSEPLPSPGTVEFELDGKTFRLDPVVEAPDDPQLFFIFRDQTAGKTTYGSGRFLYTDRPQNGTVVLDFNEAYSPPCAFTPYATCPLPPSQNYLPIAIEAGELFDGHGPGIVHP